MDQHETDCICRAKMLCRRRTLSGGSRGAKRSSSTPCVAALSLDEACRRYQLSVEEFRAWQQAIEAHGVAGLRVTRLQIYRDTPARPVKPRY